jgi:hypothetical protein
MANAGYKPVGWNCIQEALMRNKTLIRKVGEATAIMYGSSYTAYEIEVKVCDICSLEVTCCITGIPKEHCACSDLM